MKHLRCFQKHVFRLAAQFFNEPLVVFFWWFHDDEPGDLHFLKVAACPRFWRLSMTSWRSWTWHVGNMSGQPAIILGFLSDLWLSPKNTTMTGESVWNNMLFFVVSLSDPKKYYFDESLESHVLRPTWTFWNKVEKHKNHIIVCFHGDSRLMDYGHPQYAKGSKNLEQVINESTNIRVFKPLNSQLPNIGKSW